MQKKIACVFAAVLSVVSSAGAQELMYSPGRTLGVNVAPASESRWRAKEIQPAGYDRKVVREFREADFFTLEYGRPLAPFSLMIGTNGASRLWGERCTDLSGGAIRFGRGWNRHATAQARLRATVVQTGEGETSWTLLKHVRTGQSVFKTFVTKPGVNEVDVEVCQIVGSRVLFDGGLELVAKGLEGTRLDVSDLRIVPTRAPVAFRRRFTLPVKPWCAGVSFQRHGPATLTVNGEVVPEKGFAPIRGIAQFDVTDRLRAGANEVVLEYDAESGYDRCPRALVEVFAVRPDGKTDVFAGDADWEAKCLSGDWKKAVVLGLGGVERQVNGNAYATGWMPLHAGALDPVPVGGAWPVFGTDGSAAYRVSLPPALKGVRVSARVRDAFTHADVELAEADAEGCVRFATRRTGAYRLAWTLQDAAGRIVDTRETEMLLCGPLGLEEFDAEDVDAALRRRLRLVQEIDCTAAAPDGDFLDHSGFYGLHVKDVGHVVERDGFRVRETGPGWIDLLTWRIRCGTLGAPHVVEVDYPDTREQVLYASVSESYSVNFCNNAFPAGSRGWPSASGSVICGGAMPLTGRMQTLRFVFFPGSRTLTFNLENGRYAKPAAVSRIRIYEVEGTLPAMKVPPTERLYANHCERPLFFNWGNAVTPFMHEYDLDYREGMWAAAYKAIVNRIQFLKFAGHNAALEGVFMYENQFKTQSGNSAPVSSAFDPFVPLVRLYRANGIRTYLGYEYSGTAALMDDAIRSTSDRDVARGAKTLSFVDRYGRQTLGPFSGDWMNFLDERAFGSMRSLMTEIYDRYEPLGVEGVVLQTDGCGWQPTFHGVSHAQDPDEVGYGDTTVGLFERERGVSLGIDSASPTRFQARYEKLHADAKLLATWRAWRAEKQAEAHLRLAESVRTRTPWRYLFSPGCLERYAANGYGRKDYPAAGPVEFVPQYRYGRSLEFSGYARMFSDEAREMYREFDAAYLVPIGLNEHNFNRLGGAKRWWWKTYGVIVYDLKPSADFAFYDCATICRDATPKTLFHTWLDVNLTTAHDAAARRFLKGFYATPLGEGVPYPAAKGVTAHVYGGKLQLLNLTPWALVGKDGLVLKPFDLVVLGTPRPLSFDLSPEGTAAHERIVRILNDPRVRESLPSETYARWERAASPYERLAVSRESAFLDRILKYEKAEAACANQTELEKVLKAEGSVRINCGCDKPLTDETGRRWLPDQVDTGFRAYGCANASWTSRGEILIRGTDTPSVFRTESSMTQDGSLVYRFPLPDGAYRVLVRIADTYNRQDRGLIWTCGIGADVRTFNIWKLAGGTGATPVTLTFDDIRPEKGEIRIEFPCSVVNGIEIIRRGE